SGSGRRRTCTPGSGLARSGARATTRATSGLSSLLLRAWRSDHPVHVNLANRAVELADEVEKVAGVPPDFPTPWPAHRADPTPVAEIEQFVVLPFWVVTLHRHQRSPKSLFCPCLRWLKPRSASFTVLDRPMVSQRSSAGI